jgi:long-chain-fatty-acid--CoA ligase ACSBG
MNVEDVEAEYNRRLNNVFSNQCCCISFTSGTTGNPKGAMMSHDNLIWNSQNIIQTLTDLKMGEEIFVSYLPLSHVAAQVIDIFLSIALCGTVYFADSNALKGSLMNTLVDARPTFFFAVPRVYEKIQEKINSTFAKVRGVKKYLLSWAQHVAMEYHLHRTASLKYEIAKYFILDKIKQSLGLDLAKICIIGAASSNIETLKFFYGIDLPLTDAYGMTESSGVITVIPSRHAKIGSVGKQLDGIELKIMDPDDDGCGEICARGRNTFMGYLNDIQKTKECINDDGWLHSGDVGRIDSDGYLHVTGRIKELIITAGGENIPFMHIENLVKKECAAISNAFLIGDKRKFLSMLITLKTELDKNNSPTDILAPESLRLMKELKLEFTKMSEIQNHPKFIVAVQEMIDRANKNSISNAQKIQKFAILPHEFSLPTGELSPTMKLKRGFVLDKYKNIIEKFYT